MKALVLLCPLIFAAHWVRGQDEELLFGVCLTGHERTMYEPAIMAAYEESFARFKHMRTFAVLEGDESKDTKTTHRFSASDTSSDERYQQRHEGLQRYGVSEDAGTLRFVGSNDSFVAKFFEENGHCRPGGSCTQMNIEGPQRKGAKNHLKLEPGLACEARDSMEGWSHRPENGVNWAEQMWKVHLCGQLIRAWEAKRGMTFDWLLKWRPDIILLQPFPHLPLEPPNNQFVYTNAQTKDHFFLCPRHLCGGFFHDASLLHLNCSAGPSFGFSQGEKVTRMGYACPGLLASVDILYARYRPAGPYDSLKWMGSQEILKCNTVSCTQVRTALAAHADDRAALEEAVRNIVRNPPSNWSVLPRGAHVRDLCLRKLR